MASVRSATFSLRLLRSSSHYLFNFKKPALQKLVKFRNVLYASVASLTVGTGLCAIPFKQVENLSHDTLIRRAASLVTDSSSTFLSQTTLALIDAIAEYSKAVHTLIAVHKRYLDLLGKLSPAEEDSVWQVIIGQRAQVDDRWNECKRFESTWVSALRLCETAAEAAYTSGAEHASITVRTHIQVAQSQVDEAQKLSLDAEKKLAETKVMEVERMAQHAVSSQSHNDEDEVPDAYLRED
ncbi:diablo homolog, mitochondrial-like [Cynoglossus semilaevis]|uniref:Direct IAP-binding protein with low pI n=1 Tax=Cynoglossus semilaevis TaxID=244447 RepID=A0A3P8VDR4_CYNSE|nr:diablo homolog, mitochondrial-like [Cynoglossus semilaevis]